MAEDPRDGELERFLAERGGHLLRAAVLLTGSKEAGEDLVQAALERLLRRGSAVHGDPEAYLRRIIYHLAADGWRRRGRWRARLALLRGDGEGVAPEGRSEQYGIRVNEIALHPVPVPLRRTLGSLGLRRAAGPGVPGRILFPARRPGLPGGRDDGDAG